MDYNRISPFEMTPPALILSLIISKKSSNVKQKLRFVKKYQEKMSELSVLSCSAPNELRVKGDAMTQEKPNRRAF